MKFRSWDDYYYHDFIYFVDGFFFQKEKKKMIEISWFDVWDQTFWENAEQCFIIDGKEYFEGDVFKTFHYSSNSRKFYLYHVLHFDRDKNQLLLIHKDAFDKKDFRTGVGNWTYIVFDHLNLGEKKIGNIHKKLNIKKYKVKK